MHALAVTHRRACPCLLSVSLYLSICHASVYVGLWVRLCGWIGKTTLINILTGLYEATEGEAVLAGFRVGAEMEQVYRSIGTHTHT
jgi:ABC-type siderophore export system fused ATPase/permease subunit